MRLILTALLLCMVFTTGWCGKLTWQYSYSDGLAQARQRQTLALVYMLAGWNGQCKELERTTLRDKQVIDALDGFVCVKIDGEEQPDLTATLQVFGYPTLLFLNADEEVVGRIGGYIGARDLRDKIGMIRTMEETYQRLRQEIAGAPQDPQTNYALASLCVERGKYTEALPFFANVVRDDSTNTAGYTDKARLQQAYCLVELTQYDQALAGLAAFEKLHPQSALRDQMLFYRGLAYYHAGRLPEAKTALQELVRTCPQSRMAEQAREMIENIDEQK
jgi:tetratricopeptide (TPR) repeat protein